MWIDIYARNNNLQEFYGFFYLSSILYENGKMNIDEIKLESKIMNY